MSLSLDPSFYLPPGAVRSVEASSQGVHLTLCEETLHLEWMRPDILRIELTHQGERQTDSTLALRDDVEPMEVAWSWEDKDSVVTLRSDHMRVEIAKDPLAVTITRTDGSPVLRPPPASSDHAGMVGTLNRNIQLRRSLRAEDRIYGLGEKTAPLDRRGGRYTLWNTDILSPDAGGNYQAHLDPGDPSRDPAGTSFDPYYISIPFFYHQDAQTGHMAGFFIDNLHESSFDFSGEEECCLTFTGGRYIEYVMAGPRMPDILSAYHWLTGHMPLPPRWALGHHQCRWHEYSQDQVMDLARRYREKELPCDVLWIDIHYMDAYRVFTWSPSLFPDPEAMLEHLKDHGFRLISIIDPGVKREPGYPVYDDGMKKDVFCRTPEGAVYVGQVWPGRTVFPDFSLPEVRAWWGRLNARHVASGMAGIWNDMNEPATGSIPPEAMWFDRGRKPHDTFHNEYATGMAMGTVQGLKEAMPGLRTFVLSRAGSPGLHRYAANWLGDNFSRWDHLEMSLRMGPGLAVSGQPFNGADVGGFAEDSHAELLERWYQCAIFTPFLRNHNSLGHIDQYPWSFGPETEARIREALRLRYRLLPLLYSAFVRAAETGIPIQRPLVFDDQYDPRAQTCNDAFITGDHLLVAPVYTPGCKHREVPLPAGGWYDLTDDTYRTQGLHTCETPAHHIPVHVREGAVLPLFDDPPCTTRDEDLPEVLDLHLYLPRHEEPVESLLEEDDGLTDARTQGAFLRTTFQLRR